MLFLSTFFSFAAESDCNVRVNLPFSFREHEARFRGHGFQVNGSERERLVVEGEYATGNVRLGRLIVYKIVRGEPVEIGRVNAQFMQGLPSLMIARTLPIIQRECAQSLVQESQELCQIDVPHVREVKSFTRTLASCDIMDFSESVVADCHAEGFSFCFPDVRDYVEDKSQSFSFRGTNCRVVVSGKKYHTKTEQDQIRCEALRTCHSEITSAPQLNTDFRRRQLQEWAAMYQCELSLGVNQSEREAESDTPASAAPVGPSAVELR